MSQFWQGFLCGSAAVSLAVCAIVVWLVVKDA